MKMIYLVGKFNEVTQRINTVLAEQFMVQLCSDKADMFKGIMKMKVPDMVVISLVGMDTSHVKLFTELYLNYPKVPAICIGTENELMSFDQYISYGKFIQVRRPFDNKDLIELIIKKIGGSNDTSKLENKLAVNAENPEKLYSGIVAAREEGGFNSGSQNQPAQYVAKEPDRKRILLIDDNPTQLRTTKGIFPEEYEVLMATSAAEALMIIGKKKPNMIFLDYDMPVCDGKMTLEMIRGVEEARNTPVVFLTGYSDRAHIQSVIDLKPAGYLLKPADAAQILAIAKKILR